MAWLAALAVVLYLAIAVLPVLVLRRRPHRSLLQRSILAFSTFLVLSALSVAAGLLWLNGQLGSIERIDPGVDILQEQAEPGEPQNYLLVGIDDPSRAPQDSAIQVGREQARSRPTPS